MKFTPDEYRDAAYALRELSSYRRSQAIDFRKPELNDEANRLWELNAKFVKAAIETDPHPD